MLSKSIIVSLQVKAAVLGGPTQAAGPAVMDVASNGS